MADHQTQFSTKAGISPTSAIGTYETKHWSTSFLLPTSERSSESSHTQHKRALIVLNQPFSFSLFDRLWSSTQHHFCADGGANRVHDLLREACSKYLPDLIKGDLDSLRDDVKDYYTSKGVPIITDEDQYSTDLMKCISSLEEIEKRSTAPDDVVVLLGGLSGRLDQTIHTLSYLHKLRKTGRRVFAVTDENVGWVLDEGEHFISIEHSVLGPTCGLLPVGIDSTVLSTTGLRWNLSDNVSSFDGMVSTSNHLVPEESTVWVKTSRPIWWCAELKQIS
ncbi:thiamine pyrophosphokinase Thi80 [Stereum hirsutum FP-91666 SS1]|uniref:thiamine pyrophosphokinase Thi80 n=1 Tax=Stereum hirsutum (strain FP-91666) TaxID=721885 RepID=UPI000440AA73|nr:thiamine pyrophosphokinase Thi80 [Stereum hirsutum FP-91666 SS1]EIM90925.1 thiamine pyrophosphokinase Thi80 [Stereum hirsutum FP-91666 SS1]